MTKVLYPGSFDPFTKGHLHVIFTCSQIFEEVIVDIGVNTKKKRNYDALKMKSAMERVFQNGGMENVRVVIYEGATIDLASHEGADILVRGLRDTIDFSEEERNATLNYNYSGIDTIYIRAGKYGNISSSVVRELLKYNKNVEEYVPREILPLLKR